MNAEIIRERIDAAMKKAGRNDKVYFTAVSKTRTVDEMKEAEKISWVDFFGENRVQVVRQNVKSTETPEYLGD